MYLADFLSFRNTVFPSKVCSKSVRVISRVVKIAILIHTFSSLVNMNTVHGLKNQVDCVRYFDRVAMWRRKVVVYDFIRSSLIIGLCIFSVIFLKQMQIWGLLVLISAKSTDTGINVVQQLRNILESQEQSTILEK